MNRFCQNQTSQKIRDEILVNGYYRRISNDLGHPISFDVIDLIVLFYPHFLKIFGIGFNGNGEFGIGNDDQQTQFTRLNDFEQLCLNNCNNIENMYHRSGVMSGSNFFISDNRQSIYFVGKNEHSFGGLGQESGDNISKFEENKMGLLLIQNEFIQILSDGLNQTYLLYLTNCGRLFASGGGKYTAYNMLDSMQTQAALSIPTELPHISHFFQANQYKITQVNNNERNCYFLTDQKNVFYIGLSHQTGETITSPAIVPGLIEIKITKISSGYNFAVFLSNECEVYVIGKLKYLGFEDDNAYEDRDHLMEAIKKKECLNIVNIESGNSHTLCLSQNGNICGFGSNSSGKMGTNPYCETGTYSLSSEIFGGDVESIFCGADHSAVLNQQNEIFLFGANSYQQCNYKINDHQIWAPVNLNWRENVSNELNETDRIVHVILGYDTTILIISD